MKRVCGLALILSLTLLTDARAMVGSVAPQAGVQRVTLYGPVKYQHDASRALFSFKTGTFGRDWDLNYGSLYVGDDHDWLGVSTAEGTRSAVRDLGALDWTDSFSVPTVEPFPKLKEGERRTVTVDSSGADGEDGALGLPGAPGADGDGVDRARPRPEVENPAPTPRRPKRDGVPKVDPVFVKAVVGHMYVLRVVDEEHDFYVLFRVEALVRGDNCTISWRRIPPPATAAAREK